MAVAIKILHRGETPEEVNKREGRFVREVAMLARVQHKNLVNVRFFLFFIFNYNEFLFIAGEFQYLVALLWTVYRRL